MNPHHAHLLRYFDWRHLPDHLQPVSKQFQVLAVELVEGCAVNQAAEVETSAALRKLLEAKDCAVRAHVE